MTSSSAENKRQRRARGVCVSCRQPAVPERSRCEFHLEAERARTRRVARLVAVAKALREGMKTGDWKPIYAALAALDAQETK